MDNAIAQEIAKKSEQISFSDLPEKVVERSKRFILDLLGCTLGAKSVTSSKIMNQVVSNFGGNPQSTIIGSPHKTSAPFAALINGTTGHAFDMDDDHREGTLHSSVVIFPAVMAVAEMGITSGQELITAFALGSELMIRLGESFMGQSYYQGFHPTGTTGVFGAALGVGKILGLSAQKLTWSLGIAGSQAAGLLEFGSDGSWTKRMQAGHPAMGGVLSAFLAQEGYTGPATIFEGRAGFEKAYSHKEQYDLTKINGQFGSRWEMADTSIKPHACCRFSCPIADCGLELANKYDIKPDDIDDILVQANKWMIYALCDPAERKYRPQTVVDAQFSLPYAVAVTLVKKRASVPEFTDAAIKDPDVLKVASKVRWELEPEFEKLYPKVYPAQVTLTTKDGSKYVTRVDHPKGDPENPVSYNELIDKFMLLASATFSKEKLEKIIDTTMKLDKLTDISQLAGLLRI